MQVLHLLPILFISTVASATMSIIDYPTYFYTSELNGSTPVLYAGMTSNNTACTQDNINTCNSCISTTAIATGTFCSSNEVYPNLAFTVNIKTNSQSVIGQNPTVYFKIGSSAFLPTSTPTLTVNSPISVATTWASICNYAGSSAACASSFTKQTLTVGFSTDGGSTFIASESVQFTISFRYVKSSVFTTFGCSAAATTFDGVCNFTVYPGDQKVYIQPSEPHPNTSFAVGDFSGAAASISTQDTSGMTIAAVRMFYLADATISNAAYGAGPAASTAFQTVLPYQDLKFAFSTNTFTFDKKVTGLTNNINYYFVAATVDQAGIATLFTDPAALTATFAPGAYGTEQATKPQPVYGLLDNQSCFIATAAYGSSLAPEVDSFRKFRGQFLLSTKVGRFFVRTYYKYSPPLANFIAQNEVLRFGARILLAPLLVFVKLALWLGLIPSIGLLFLLVFGVGYSLRKGKII